MFGRSCSGTLSVMDIRIRIDHLEPPEGRLFRVEDGTPGRNRVGTPFVGWLGLLRALAEVMGSPHRR